MNSKIKKILTIMIFTFLILFSLNGIVMAATAIDKDAYWTAEKKHSYDASKNGTVSSYDFALHTGNQEHGYRLLSTMPAKDLRAKYVYATGDTKDAIQMPYAFCVGHGNTNRYEGDGTGLLKIATIIDVTPEEIVAYGHGRVGNPIPTSGGPKSFETHLNPRQNGKLGNKTASRCLSALAYYAFDNADSTDWSLPTLTYFLNWCQETLSKEELLDYGIGFDYDGKTQKSSKALFEDGNGKTKYGNYADKVQNHEVTSYISLNGAPNRYEEKYGSNTYDYWGPFNISSTDSIDKISLSMTGGTEKYVGIASRRGGAYSSSDYKNISPSDIKNNTDFYIVTTTSTSTAKRTITLKVTTKPEFYKARFMFFKCAPTTGTSGANNQNVLIMRATTTTLTDQVTIPVTPDVKPGTLTITKKSSEDGSKLAGAQFKLYDSLDRGMKFSGPATNCKCTGRGTTKADATLLTVGNDGVLVLNNLPGDEKYTLEEINAPAGYKKKSATVDVTIDSGGNVSKDVYNDLMKGSLQIFKYDEQLGKSFPLSSAEFLIIGPKGGVLIPDEISSGVYKYNGYTTSSALSNYTFRTNGSGKIYISNLPLGEYKIREYRPPAGYKSYSGDKIVNIDEEKEYIAEIPEAPELGDLKIIKVDTSNPERKVSGIGFKIYCRGNGWVTLKDGVCDRTNYSTNYNEAPTFYTTDTGEVTIEDLPTTEGYDIYEVDLGENAEFEKLPQMYVPYGNGAVRAKEVARNITVPADGTYSVKAYNNRHPGKIQIHKIDTSGKNRENGIGFKIYDETNNKWLQIDETTGELTGRTDYYNYATELKTDSTGYTKQISYLPLGKYHVYETSLGAYSDIYKLEEPLQVSYMASHAISISIDVKDCGSYNITSSNTVVSVEAKNSPTDYTLKIQKVDTSGKNRVIGLGFKIYDETNGEWLIFDTTTGKYTGETPYYNLATEAITNAQGSTVEITGLSEGIYHVYETSLGDYSEIYSLEDTLDVQINTGAGHYGSTITVQQTVDVNDMGTCELNSDGPSKIAVAENTPKPVPGTIRIKKIDITDGVDNGVVSNIGFKIFDYTNKKWLQINNTTGEITGNTEDFEQASEITTDSTGYTVQVKDVPPGIYQVFETNLNEHINTYTLGTVTVYDEGANVSKTGNQIETTYEVKQNEGTNVEVTAINSKTISPVKLIIKKTDKGTGNVVSGIGFKIFDSTNQKWLQINNTTGVITGNTEDFEQADEITTDSTGYTVEVKDLPGGTYEVYETNLGTHNEYKLEKVNVYDEGSQVQKDGKLIKTVVADNSGRTISVEAENEQLGRLKIKKVDTSGLGRVNGIGFKIFDDANGGWLRIDNETGEFIDRTPFYSHASEIRTDSTGYTKEIISLPIGRYHVYETSLGSYSDIYKLEEIKNVVVLTAYGAKMVDVNIKDCGIKEITANNMGEVSTVTAENTPIRKIDLSGYVWENGLNYGKTATMDNIYDESVAKDQKLSGINVYLVNAIGTTVQTATTDSNGNYKFTDVDVDSLKDYTISFSYNGLKYQVINNSDTNGENTNKCVETSRETFNQKFSTINKNQTSTGETLGYTKNAHISTLIENNNQMIKAQTKQKLSSTNGIIGTTTSGNVIASIDEIKNNNITEITNINLGIYRRTAPDLEVREYMYQIISTDKNAEVDSNNTWQLNKLGINSDLTSTDEYSIGLWDPINQKVLTKTGNEAQKVYMVYKIALVNSATGINNRINTVTTRYDNSNYTFVGAELAKSNYTDPSKLNSENITIDGSKVTFNNLNLDVESRKTAYLFVKFEVPVEELTQKLITGGDIRLDRNYTEIDSYTSYTDKDALYAGVDKDSAPGNMDIETFSSSSEDDEGCAPTIVLTAKSRTAGATASARATDFIDKLMSAKFSE